MWMGDGADRRCLVGRGGAGVALERDDARGRWWVGRGQPAVGLKSASGQERPCIGVGDAAGQERSDVGFESAMSFALPHHDDDPFQFRRKRWKFLFPWETQG